MAAFCEVGRILSLIYVLENSVFFIRKKAKQKIEELLFPLFLSVS